MPAVSPNPTLRDALAAYIAQTGATKADAAAKLGVDPMTLARFLKTGRVIDANRRKLETGLTRVGGWHQVTIDDEAEGQGRPDPSIISTDKVIAALEFLLGAARNARAGTLG
ncbi:MAG: hypothetical protein H0X36_08725 [Sphingomonadaceae bacterium]|nr:hypothetical protein [Sphingomonadaceae bacterium]